MIDKTKRMQKEALKERTRRRMHAAIDEDNYEYIPAENRLITMTMMFISVLRYMLVYQQEMKGRQPHLNFNRYTMRIS